MKDNKLLVIGSGGREHTIIWKLLQSEQVSEVHAAPGNGGISKLAKCVDIDACDIKKMVAYAKKECFDMVVVAPDEPLSIGMVDALEEAGIRAFGPNKAAARIEASKAFSKDLMRKYNIPTADYATFYDYDKALDYIINGKLPIVIKADGLALGKGAVICNTLTEAKNALYEMMIEKKFGDSGECVVIEEFMTGPEVSILAFADGKSIKPMVSAQDHKRAYDNDKGPNTGGMGTFSPSRVYNKEIEKITMETIIKPTMDAMKKEGCPFKGVLFFGLMLTEDGPKVIEYNARFGDPETQVVLPRLKSDIFDIFQSTIDGTLENLPIKFDENACVCVVVASGGYPVEYKKGYEISGIDKVDGIEKFNVFHAGTKVENDKYFSNGGRVLGVSCLAENLDTAIENVYKEINSIKFKDSFYRKDIGIK